MILTDMKLTINKLEERLADRYEVIFIGDKKCFSLTDGQIISLDSISSYNAVVVEYAEDINAAKLNQFEDGDCFSLDQYNTDALFNCIVDEIES